MEPPFTTSHNTSVSTMDLTLSAISPSSRRIVSPTETSVGSPAYVTETLFSSPSISLVVRVNDCFSFNSTLSAANFFTLISGPLV